MPSTNKTRNLQLNQYIGSDKMKRVDLTEDLQKIDEAISVVLKDVSFSNGNLTLTKYNNTNSTVQIFNNIGNDVRGLTTFNEINGLIDTKLNGVGLATSIVSNVDLQSYFATRLFQSNSSSKINGKTTVGINWQYDSTWGVQLGITEEESPKLYIRSKQRGTWRGWNEMATVESVNNVKSALERKIEEKINERIGNFDDIWRGL